MYPKYSELAVSNGVVAKTQVNRDVRLVRRHWRLALGAYLTMVLAGTMACATFGELERKSLVLLTLT